MKTNKFQLTLFAIIFTFTSCSKDDDPAPEVVNEEEVITTLEVTLTSGSSTIIMKTQDLDGDGPNPPVVTVSGNLTSGIVYDGAIKVLNELETPAEDITEEVEEESDEHQFFFTPGGGLDVTTEYSNFDSTGNNLGTQFKLTTGSASSGRLTFTLRHEPTKPNSGLVDAGGETDVEATFNITID